MGIVRTAPGLTGVLCLVWMLGLLVGCASMPVPEVERSRAGQQYVPEPGLAGEEREFTSGDGARLGYVSYTQAGVRTALVYVHGIESHAGWFALAATLLRDEGFDVYCLDRRGSGLNRENRGFVSGHITSYEVLFADIRAFVRPLRERYEQVFLVGLSWGGKLALGYALAHPEDVDGLVLITPGIRALVDVDWGTKVQIALFSKNQPEAAIRLPIQPEMFTTTPRYLEFILEDPLRLRYATASFLWESHRLDGYVDRQMPHNHLPVQLFLAGRDRIIDNAGVRAVLERGTPDQLEVLTYPDQTHSIQLGAAERLVADMTRWFESHEKNAK